ncbi:MAG: hypothetical protein ACD_78C00036G0003, partial [uncultured bacterium (gcode 4)]
NREVFALPGEIGKATSIGTNSLIRDGQAKLILGTTDILSEYEMADILTLPVNITDTPKFGDPLEASIYELIKFEPLDISSLGDKTGIDISMIACKLSMMEVHGIVEMNIDGSYSIK